MIAKTERERKEHFEALTLLAIIVDRLQPDTMRYLGTRYLILWMLCFFVLFDDASPLRIRSPVLRITSSFRRNNGCAKKKAAMYKETFRSTTSSEEEDSSEIDENS